VERKCTTSPNPFSFQGEGEPEIFLVPFSFQGEGEYEIFLVPLSFARRGARGEVFSNLHVTSI